MFNEEESRFFVTIDDQEVEMEIYFTFQASDDFPKFANKKYVVYFDPSKSDEDVVLYCCSYDDEGNLYPVNEEDEWEMVSEVVNTFNSDDEEE